MCLFKIFHKTSLLLPSSDEFVSEQPSIQAVFFLLALQLCGLVLLLARRDDGVEVSEELVSLGVEAPRKLVALEGELEHLSEARNQD